MGSLEIEMMEIDTVVNPLGRHFASTLGAAVLFVAKPFGGLLDRQA
jgi:hypothetical protein